MERLDLDGGKLRRGVHRIWRICVGSCAGDAWPRAPLAAGVILLFALLQWKSMHVGSGVQNFTSIIKVALFLAVAVLCFSHPATPVAAAAPGAALRVAPTGWPLFVAFILALQSVIYAYDGWYGVVYFGSEIRNPGRQIPRAIFGTVLSVLGVYFLVNAAVLHLVPVHEIAGSDFAMGIAARRVLGDAGTTFIRLVIVVGLLSSVNAMEMATSRALYAMSRDKLFFPLFARVNAAEFRRPRSGFRLRWGCVLRCSTSSASRRFWRRSSWPTMHCRSFPCLCCGVGCRKPHVRIAPGATPWTTGLALMASVESLTVRSASDRQNSTARRFWCWPRATPVYRTLEWAARRRETA